MYYTIKYDWLIPGYFIFAILDMVIGFLGFPSIQKFNMLYLFICMYYVLVKKEKRIETIDILIILLCVFIAFGVLLSDTQPELLWSGVRYQLLPMIFFFVGKYYLVNNRFMEIGKYIIIGNAILGLFLFITEPAWYISWKMNLISFDATQSNLYYEMTRLSSLSAYPYWVSYSSFILYAYYLTETFYYSEKTNKKNYLILAFLFVIMLLCQQRSPLLCAGLSTFLLIWWSREKGNCHVGCMQIFVFLLFGGTLVIYLLNNMEEAQHDFIIDKLNSITEGKNLVKERNSTFMVGKDLSILGEGIGKYSHNAIALNKRSIPDQQYLRIMYETGIVGMLLYGLIFIRIMFQGLKNKTECIFDLLVVIFYMFSMIGANSLSMEGYHTAVFWFCCGRLFNENYIQYKRKNNK